MTSFKTVLKSNIQSVELSKKKVKITCANKNAGNKVITTLGQNVSLFGSNNYDVKKGLDGAKDFTVKFDGKNGKAEAEAFYDNLIAITNDSSVPVEEPEKSGIDNFKEGIKRTVDKGIEAGKQALGIPPAGQTAAPTPAPTAAPSATAVPEAPGTGGGSEAPEGSDNKKLFIIGGAVFFVIVIALVIWKAKK
jgi:hypothetical protein